MQRRRDTPSREYGSPTASGEVGSRSAGRSWWPTRLTTSKASAAGHAAVA